FVANFQGGLIEPLTPAHWTGDCQVRKKVQGDFLQSLAQAAFAAAAAHVEAETTGAIAPCLRLARGCEHAANFVKKAGEGCGTRPRRPAQWRLIDFDYFVELVQPVDAVMSARSRCGESEMTPGRVTKNVAGQRTLARSAHPGYAYQAAEGKGDVNVLEIVLPRASNANAAGGGGRRQQGPRTCHRRLNDRDRDGVASCGFLGTC